MSKGAVLTAIFSFLVLMTRSTVFVFTPLYLDSLTPSSSVEQNISNTTNRSDTVTLQPSFPTREQIAPIFAIATSMCFDTIVLGILLLVIRFFYPDKITEKETRYPKSAFVIAGGSQGVSSLLFLYASSGARTAPYLQAILGNFNMPFTFIIRYHTKSRAILQGELLLLGSFDWRYQIAAAMSKGAVLTAIFTFLVLMTRSTVFVFTPLYLDSLTPSFSIEQNVSNTTNRSDTVTLQPSFPTREQIDPIFAIVISMGFDTIVLGILLSVIRCLYPEKITDKETKYPKSAFLIAGGSQGVSSLLFLYASSGARTAPYLQAILGNFHIPITFTLRFFMLRKRPTLRKFACATCVLISELVTMLPTIFPELENSSEHRIEGGATGAARILWPVCFVGSMVPAGISNVVLERTVKDDGGTDKRKLNMIYTLFWTYLSIFLTCVAMFWSDLIPGFGTSPSIKIFGQLMLFNIRCIFGAEEKCQFPVPFYAWGRMISKTFNVLCSAYLLRYGEGASFLVIVLAMRTPVVFLFWTLFKEHPFQWLPHIELSTWLSIGAIFVMIPAMIIYQTGPPERTVGTRTEATLGDAEEDEQPILPSQNDSDDGFESLDDVNIGQHNASVQSESYNSLDGLPTSSRPLAGPGQDTSFQSFEDVDGKLIDVLAANQSFKSIYLDSDEHPDEMYDTTLEEDYKSKSRI